MIYNHLSAAGTVRGLEGRERYPGIDLIPGARHDFGLIPDLFANQRLVEVDHLLVEEEVGDRCHLDLNQFYIIAVLGQGGVELERLEPLVHLLASRSHVVAFLQGDELQGDGTVAAERFDMGLTFFRCVDHPIVFLGALFGADAMEER